MKLDKGAVYLPYHISDGSLKIFLVLPGILQPFLQQRLTCGINQYAAENDENGEQADEKQQKL